MMRSAARKSAGPIVFANAGTSVVRLRKLVRAFCSIVRGCRRAPIRWVWAFHCSNVANSRGEVRLPERDVADPADPENHRQLGPLPTARRRSSRHIRGAGRSWRSCVATPARSDRREGRRRPIPSRSGRHRGPFEGSVLPSRVLHSSMLNPWTWSHFTPPFAQEVDRPTVHAHRADRQDQCAKTPEFARPTDRLGDLVAELDVEILDRLAGDRAKPLVPPGLAVLHLGRRVGRAGVDSARGPNPGAEILPSSTRRTSSGDSSSNSRNGFGCEDFCSSSRSGAATRRQPDFAGTSVVNRVFLASGPGATQ